MTVHKCLDHISQSDWISSLSWQENGRTATESAHIDIISERLRLLYVGITRARRSLHLSRSRTTRTYNKERDAEPATVLAVLYHYLKGR